MLEKGLGTVLGFSWPSHLLDRNVADTNQIAVFLIIREKVTFSLVAINCPVILLTLWKKCGEKKFRVC